MITYLYVYKYSNKILHIYGKVNVAFTIIFAWLAP